MLNVKHTKRGRPAKSLIEQAYQQGLRDGGSKSYNDGFRAGWEKSVETYAQAIRFLKFEGHAFGTKTPESHLMGNGNVRGIEGAGSGGDEGTDPGDSIQGQALAFSQ